MDFLRRDVLGRGRSSPTRGDVESHSLSPTGSGQAFSPQMEELPTTSPSTSARTRRFSLSRPTFPNLLRGRANATTTQQSRSEPELMEQTELDSPKTPTNRYTLTLSNFTSSRLDLPHLASPTSTNGFRSPTLSHHVRSPTFSTYARSPMVQNTTSPALALNSVSSPSPRPTGRLSRLSDSPAYPSDEVVEDPVIAHPAPAVRAEHRRTIRFEGIEPEQRREAQQAQINPPPEEADTGSGRSRFRRHRNHRRRHHHHTALNTPENGQQGRTEQGTTGPRPPKRFLFCFPWIKSRKIRNQILTCFVSGMFLVLMLGVYLALTLTHQISSSQFTILIILIILFTTIIFCHALIRLCLYVVRPPTEEETERTRMNHFVTPGGYAIPRRPIRVMLARDEEAAGVDSETVHIKPPAYGLWRESVRVDPNRIYWQRNEEAQAGGSSSASSSGSNGNGRSSSPRPPSYVSEDGVDYVVDARPRSIAPTTDVPLPPHPSEARNRTQPPAW